MTMQQIIKGNILDWAREYDGPKFHAILCDPPYHLTSVTRIGRPGDIDPTNKGQTESPFPQSRNANKGFMGRDWDGGDVAFRSETWAALAKHLHPGAFGMAFASSRGWHRMAVAIEDAGLIIHPTMFLWNYASGFPKATRIDTQISNRWARANYGGWCECEDCDDSTPLQVEICSCCGKPKKPKGAPNPNARQTLGAIQIVKKDGTGEIPAPATDEAAAWQGHRYGLQAIKPAVEPVIVFQKPYSRAGAVEDMLATGAGALWIDGGRIPSDSINKTSASAKVSDGWDRPWRHDPDAAARIADRKRISNDIAQELGRWPANLLLQHLPTCNGACDSACPVARLGVQSGESGSKASQRGAVKIFSDETRGSEGWTGDSTERGHDDEGTAARYFFQADYALDRLEAADPVYYCAKASRAEREAGLDPRTVALMRALDDSDEGEDLPEYETDHSTYGEFKGIPGTKHTPNQRRARFDEVTVDDGRQTPIDNPYLRGETTRRNIHPTVKPLSLARYLATLLLPPDRYAPRRILVPFAGVASEMIGAMLAGWDEVVGVELDEDDTHIPVAEARLSYWRQRRAELSDPSKPITIKAAPKMPAGQRDMFEEAA